MADVIFEELFSDKAALEYLEQIEKQLGDVGKAADKTGEELHDAFSPSQLGLGVSDALTDLRKKYQELQRASVTLRSALRNATDPTAVKLYQKGIADLNTGMKTLETSAKKAGVSLKETNKEVSLGKQVFRDFFGEFTKATIIVYAIQKVIEFTKFAVDMAQQTRLATLQFEAFTGSAQQAGDIVSRLQGFSAEKFLDTGQVLQAGKALLAFGEEADNLTPVLSRVADISAATGKNFNELVTIYGKARAAGVLYAEDINQLVDAGIPIIGEFAKQMGVTTGEIKKLASEGKISFEELQLAFFNLTKEGGKFADQAELNAETIGGAWRGLLAELEPIIGKVGQFFSDVATTSLNAVRQFVSDIKDFGGAAFFGATSADKEAVGAFFDIPVQASKEANEEQKKLEEAAAKRRRELANQTSKQQQEAAAKRRQQRIDEFNQTLADIDAQARALAIEGTFNPLERVQAEYSEALRAARELETRLVSLADTPEQKAIVKKSMERLFDELLLSYNEEVSKAEQEIAKIRKGLGNELLPLPQANVIDDDLVFRAKETVEKIKTAIQGTIAGQEPRSLAEILGLSEEGLEGLKDAANQVIDSLGEIADARVKEADAAVDAAERRVNAAQEALIREQDLAEQGLANNTDLARQQLDTAKKLQEEAEKERAKAIRTQILLDAASQISSLITSSASIFKSLAPLGPFGIAGAIATIAVMFGAFAKAKSDALKAAAIPKFRKGGKLEGPAHEYGGIAISDNDGNVYGEAEGGEWIVNRQGSREHDRFLNRLNKGEFAGVDLNQYIPTSGGSAVLSDSARRIERVDRERREIEVGQNYAAIVAAHERAANSIVTAIREQPEIYPLTNYKVRRRKGRNTYTEIVREEK